MNAALYRQVARYAGRHLSYLRPFPVPAVTPFPVRVANAVYIATDAATNVVYVGSVARTTGGVATRIAEHLTDWSKRHSWRHVWVIPLRLDTSIEDVRSIEGVVGAHLGPTGSQYLPRVRPPINADRAE